jgi:hypothetical protein
MVPYTILRPTYVPWALGGFKPTITVINHSDPSLPKYKNFLPLYEQRYMLFFLLYALSLHNV